jgi:aspartyl protease family protein
MFGLDDDQLLNLLYLVTLLALIIAFAGWRRNIGAGLRHLAIWALIALGLVALYAYRAPLQRFAAPVLHELDPSRVVEVVDADGATELVIRRGPDGHFHLDADANGVPVRFLVDTGATSTVLTIADAERSGIDTLALEFDRPVRTANGVAFYARAVLDSLEIGPFRLSDVAVGVMPEDTLDTSLLGMSTIDRFAGWRIAGDEMVLVP